MTRSIKKKNVLVLAIIICFMFVLAGCMGVNSNIVIKEDGSGTYVCELCLDESIYGFMQEGEKDYYESNGFTKETKTIDGSKYICGTKAFTFKSLDELKDIISNLGNKIMPEEEEEDYGDSTSVEEEQTIRCDNLTKDTFHVIMPALASYTDDKEMAEMNESFKVFFNFEITFPKEVVYTNGTLSTDKKTVTWNIKNNKVDSLLYATMDANKSTIVDTKAPEIIDAIGDNWTKQRLITNEEVMVSSTDDNGVKSATLNGKEVAQSCLLTKSGEYTYIAIDLNGNQSKVTFIIDKKKPTINGVANGKKYTKPCTITFKDTNGIKSAKINNKKIISPYKVSKPGAYTLKVTDKAGNTKTVKFTIKK